MSNFWCFLNFFALSLPNQQRWYAKWKLSWNIRVIKTALLVGCLLWVEKKKSDAFHTNLSRCCQRFLMCRKNLFGQDCWVHGYSMAVMHTTIHLVPGSLDLEEMAANMGKGDGGGGAGGGGHMGTVLAKPKPQKGLSASSPAPSYIYIYMALPILLVCI